MAWCDATECEGVTQSCPQSPRCPSAKAPGSPSLDAWSGQCGERRRIPVPLVHPGDQEHTGWILFPLNSCQPWHPVPAQHSGSAASRLRWAVLSSRSFVGLMPASSHPSPPLILTLGTGPRDTEETSIFLSLPSVCEFSHFVQLLLKENDLQL